MQVELQIDPVLISCILMSWDVQVPFLSEDVIRCVPLLGLSQSRSRDVFALLADADNYKIKIKDLALFVRNVQLSPA